MSSEGTLLSSVDKAVQEDISTLIDMAAKNGGALYMAYQSVITFGRQPLAYLLSSRLTFYSPGCSSRNSIVPKLKRGADYAVLFDLAIALQTDLSLINSPNDMTTMTAQITELLYLVVATANYFVHSSALRPTCAVSDAQKWRSPLRSGQRSRACASPLTHPRVSGHWKPTDRRSDCRQDNRHELGRRAPRPRACQSRPASAGRAA